MKKLLVSLKNLVHVTSSPPSPDSLFLFSASPRKCLRINAIHDNIRQDVRIHCRYFESTKIKVVVRGRWYSQLLMSGFKIDQKAKEERDVCVTVI